MNQPTTPTSSIPGPGDGEDGSGAPWADDPAEAAAQAVVMADLVLAGRHASTAQYLAGLMAAAELDAVGRVDRLPRDLFPDADPVLVQEVWEKACAVAWRAAGEYFAARHDPAVLAAAQAEFESAGFHAMAGTVARSLRVVERASSVHPADGRPEREH
ncbi:hypothetical protein F3K34_43755 [Streptomyces sp. LBUM 1486]|uniref:hypothetical protein n=1 Tax=Streptomyces scabiei TaxID=1930 RepID=UPI001B33A8A3|nr:MULTISPECIES: hypothetical protein [Streptomyces]MBP5918703.1 hypothetical protein [Streptomyces sp. LBUM 1486]MDX2800171.1 hypothetical protein [Streptomyces scabiei]MDX3125838.1 hypothetical protein [Streptomyces scabiei]MDX3283728.1 hypothetical protein [Streptomyces scabiei]MDX3283729.1 hypothetical protein [Streptomyces scabiei]